MVDRSKRKVPIKSKNKITVFQALTMLMQQYLANKEKLALIQQIYTKASLSVEDQKIITKLSSELGLKDTEITSAESLLDIHILLAQRYHNDRENLAAVRQLYLMGVQTPEDKVTLTRLLADPSLNEYVIDNSKKAINDDPVRRYFESHLCNETLKHSLDKLDKKKLSNHYNKVFNKIPFVVRSLIPATIYRGSVHGIAAKKSDTAPEYISALQVLRDKKSFSSLNPGNDASKAHVGKIHKRKIRANKKKFNSRKSKMMLLAKTAHAAMTAVSLRNEKFPLNLYQQEGSVYQGKMRGRVDRKDEADNKQTVTSNTLGIMRSYMPLPRSDVLHNEKSAKYVRPTDKSTYVEGAAMPEAIFGTEVTPFVNSISGTMLCQLRIMAELVQSEQFDYANDPEQLKEFMRSFVSYMLLNSGGHSIHEFLAVLKLPEIQEEFANVFPDIDMYQLFQEENQKAFEAAIHKTIEYNSSIMQRSNVRDEVHRGVTGLNHIETRSQDKGLPDWVKDEYIKSTGQGILLNESAKKSLYKILQDMMLILGEIMNNETLQRFPELNHDLDQLTEKFTDINAKVARGAEISPHELIGLSNQLNQTQVKANACFPDHNRHISEENAGSNIKNALARIQTNVAIISSNTEPKDRSSWKKFTDACVKFVTTTINFFQKPKGTKRAHYLISQSTDNPNVKPDVDAKPVTEEAAMKKIVTNARAASEGTAPPRPPKRHKT